MIVRSYRPDDYHYIASLYEDPSTFGGQFDNNRDAEERLNALIAKNDKAILVAEVDGKIVGTVTIFEDGRSCWLYRFAVKDNNQEVAAGLIQKAREMAKELGHAQFLVYAPANNADFETRYTNAGFTKGGDYSCYWMDI